MYNKFIGIGNLTKDPELRHTPSDVAVVTLSVAFNSKYSQGGEIKEEVLFLNVVIFGKQAEACEQYLSKGSPVLVEGRLRENKWEYEGKTHRRIEVIASAVRFLPKKEKVLGREVKDAEISEEPEEIAGVEPF